MLFCTTRCSSLPLTSNLPLFAALLAGGIPMMWGLLKRLAKRQFGSDLLAGAFIITAILLREYLVATIVVLMLSGGEALEEFATARASSVLDALARRVPSIAHRKQAGGMVEVKLRRHPHRRRTHSSCRTKSVRWTAPSRKVAAK